MGNFYWDLYANAANYLSSLDIDLSLYKDDPQAEFEIYRLAKYKVYWNAYNNPQSLIPAKDGEDPIKLNLSKAFIDRSIDFLVGNPPSFYAPERYSKLMGSVINYITVNAGMDLFCMEVAINAAVCGDSFIKVIWDDLIQSVRFQLLDSEKVFVKYLTSDRNRTVLVEAVIVWEGEYVINDRVVPVLFKERWTETEYIKSLEYIRASAWEERDENKMDSWRPDILLARLFAQTNRKGIIRTDLEEMVLESKVNDLGFIPVVHLRNQTVPVEIYGRSDLCDLVSISSYINQTTTQYLKSVKYHGSPVTMIFGAKIGNLRRGPNKIWSGLPKDSKVEQLGGSDNFPAIKELMEVLLDYAYISSSVPEASTGLFQHLSNATGVALQVQYLPLTGLTKRKRISQTPAFVQCFEYGLKLLDRNLGLNLQKRVDDYVKLGMDIHKEKIIQEVEVAIETDTTIDDMEVMEKNMIFELENLVTVSPFWKVEMRWGDYLPKDSSLELQEILQEMEVGLESRRGALRRRGVLDIEEKIKELDDDQQRQIASQNAFTAANMQDFSNTGGINEDGTLGPPTPEQEAVTEENSAQQKEAQLV